MALEVASECMSEKKGEFSSIAKSSSEPSVSRDNNCCAMTSESTKSLNLEGRRVVRLGREEREPLSHGVTSSRGMWSSTANGAQSLFGEKLSVRGGKKKKGEDVALFRRTSGRHI